MSSSNPSGKAQRDRLVEIEEQMLYLVEVPDSIRYLESRVDEISEKANMIDAVAGRVEGLPIKELLARVDALEENTNARRTINYERGESSSGFGAHMEERVGELDNAQKTLLEMINGMSEDFRVTLDVVRNEIADVNARLSLTMRAMANQAPAGGAISVSKVKVPEPKPFCGARDAKALENYIFDLEQYFKATNTIAEEAKVTLATMHLSEDAKLWWRSRYVDIQEGRCTVDTWDALKRELRSQFFPENVEILARRKLRDLRHTGEIREYVKQFAGLMLDIRDMSEKDKVFYFVEGLKPWARAKLYEQRVQDLTSAYAAAERLFDLTSDSQDARRNQSSSPRRNRDSRPSSPKAVGGDKRSGKDRKPYQSTTENTWRRPNDRSPNKRPLSCFICQGPHLARECPNKVDFHAFQASLIAESDDKSNQVEDEAGLIGGGEKTRIGAIKYMSSLQKKSGESHVPSKGGLLYVDTWINQKQTKSTMVDSGATHNFITEAEARRLGLHWERDSGKMKAVNSIALPIVGLVKRTTIKLGGWRGPVDFVVVKMDDFDVVLGMEFLLEHQVIPMPSAKCLAITGSFPTVVQADIRQPNGFRMISAMQLDGSRAQEEPPSVEILVGALEKPGETVPKDTLCVPEKRHGVMPSSWPKSSSRRRRTDHGKEPPSEAKAHAKNAYRMAPPELTKLREPSETLLNTGCSIPVQAPYGARVLSLKKKDRSPQQCVDRRTQSKLTDCVVRRDRQSGIDIDMIRVIRWDRSQPDCLSVSSGYTTDQFVLGVPLGSPKTRYVSTGSHVARVRERASEGKGRGKLASDRKGSVTCHMGTQFCFHCFTVRTNASSFIQLAAHHRRKTTQLQPSPTVLLLSSACATSHRPSLPRLCSIGRRTSSIDVDPLSMDSIEGHNQVSGKRFPATGPRIEARNVVIHRGLYGNVIASGSLCAIVCNELFTDRHQCLDVLCTVVMLMGYIVNWNCMSMDLKVLRLGLSFGITRLIRASFGITRLICASFGITRLIGVSFGVTRLIRASFGITRLMCPVVGLLLGIFYTHPFSSLTFQAIVQPKLKLSIQEKALMESQIRGNDNMEIEDDESMPDVNRSDTSTPTNTMNNQSLDHNDLNNLRSTSSPLLHFNENVYGLNSVVQPSLRRKER
ncbi:uncharacterized protein E5676_scaffold208G001250 [Cucumis melo var. makuwa]|uniref:Retrotransposon gag domain-containing protein n=1 Tax=Cucumis melo var. makuwa TaxID=1194695 RepID=A0A5D3E1A7_CUCMM|nr:uncharacterized protein E5676_scaffold208G001250 [Cucumis melo var. makuwa]